MITAALVNLLVGATTALAGIARVAPSDGITPLSCPVGDLHWEGEVIPGHGNVTLHGTAETISNAIHKINPDFQAPKHARVDKVDDTNQVYDCDPLDGELEWTGWDQMEDEMHYLEDLGDTPCNAGPLECARVSCSYNTAVWMCNHRDYNWGPTCFEVSEKVLDIAQTCQKYNRDHTEYDVRGKMVHLDDHYSVWIGRAFDGC